MQGGAQLRRGGGRWQRQEKGWQHSCEWVGSVAAGAADGDYRKRCGGWRKKTRKEGETEASAITQLPIANFDWNSPVLRESLFPAYARGEECIAEASAAAPPPSPASPGSGAAALQRRQP